MKLTRFLALVGLVAFASTLAYANPIDPTIFVGGGSGSVNLTSLTFPTLTFPNDPLCSSTSATIMTCLVRNGTGVAFTSLTFFITPAQTPLSLSSTIFGSTSFTTSGGVATFSGGLIPACPAAGCEFTIGFTNFLSGTTFNIVANVPEPGTIALFLGGLGALWARRKLGLGTGSDT